MEFYRYDYADLVRELGEEEALKKVEQYLKMSEQFHDTKTFVVHDCKLLKTYAEKAGKAKQQAFIKLFDTNDLISQAVE
jgi:hypothetical protein